MQHIKPLGKGDPLCPLGFHPQVRWPTRCKRCFRDYKEHGNRNKEQSNKLNRNDTTASSSPSLSSWNSKPLEDKDNCLIGTRSWTSISNLNANNNQPPKNYENVDSISTSNTSSWISTPNLAQLSDTTKPNSQSATIILPRRRPIRSISEENTNEDDYRRTAYTVRRRTTSNLNIIPIPETENENSVPKNEAKTNHTANEVHEYKDEHESDVFTDAASTIHTDDTETIVNDSIVQEQIENLKVELNTMRIRCEKAEKEKNEMLLRRVASLDSTMSTKATTSELSKLQEKLNTLNQTCEALQQEKRILLNKIRDFENAAKSNKNSAPEEEINSLKSKLQAAESLCEELMDENEEMKRELRDMEEEIEEMQDNFRENEADEYSSIKKELEQTGKNCRILSFKLRKCERKTEQLEADKFECERKSREVIQRLQKELDEVNEKLRLSNIEDARRKAPMLGNIPKTPSGEKVSRASLTRGGSQEDPIQLLRDLQDSMEREADLREQLRYAEEEAENLRKKVSRVEDDNESLLMQLKKMATKAKSRRSSPTYSRLGNELSVEKDEGISDDEDPAELRLLLELSEQESAVLHKKIKELEENCDILKRKASDLQGKLLAKEQKSPKNRLKEPTKAQETEIQELKNKLQEKERECVRLSSEISCLKRNSKPTQKARSVDNDRNSVDLQRQLKIVEQEASVLRTRICSLESENEKLQNENKQLAIVKISKKSSSQTENELRSEILSLKKQLNDAHKTPSQFKQEYAKEMNELKEKQSELESENARLATSLKLLKEGTTEEIIEFLKKRTPKIVTDNMPKETLKRMVENLECEIAELLLLRNKANLGKVSDSNFANSNSVSFELEKTKQKLEKLLNERKEEKAKFEKLTSEKRKFETAQTKQDEIKEKEKSILKKEKERLENDKKKLVSEIENLKTQIMNLNEDLRSSQSKHNETNDLLAATCRELEEKRSAMDSLKRQLESALNAAKEDGKLKTEISEKKKKIADLEKKLQDAEDKNKKSERLMQVKKEKIVNLEKEVELLKKEMNAYKNSKSNDSESWMKRENELKATIEDLRKQIEKKCDEIRGKESKIKELEKIIWMKGNTFDGKSASNNVSKLSDLEKKLTIAQAEVTELNDKIKKLEVEKKEVQENAQSASAIVQSEMNALNGQLEKLRASFESERSTMSQRNDDQMKQIAAKDTELEMLKKKISNAGNEKINDVKKEFESKLNNFKDQLESKKREYDELTNKYEILEDEHVKLKSQANLQKEQMHSQVACTQKELTSVQNELRTLRETYNSRQDNWIKEKLKLEDKITELENMKSNNETYKLELNKLKLMLDAKHSELEKVHKENIMNIDQMDHMRKENEELQKKLDDYDKVINVQRNMVAEASMRESEMRELKARLYNEEQGRKVEVAALKLRYENHVAAISSELKDVQAQVMRFKHERNTYKHLLENAQKVVSEVRNSAPNKESTINHDEFMDELRNQVATLEQQISCMEDELSEARVESSRLKTELVSERSAWDVKLSEMTSRINELEEERMLSGGRSKTVGLKTRIELSWQKEREEQNRLLQETSTLARDLRQTLFEVERERDKERLEMKRRIEQMKKNAEEEQEETKKKLQELQCDLLELRDAHAKLRTTNEKLRREKERLDREKDLIKQNSKLNSLEYDQKKVSYVLDLIYELSQTNLSNASRGLPPMPPSKKQSTPSRESSVDLRNSSRENSLIMEDTNTQFQQMLQRLFEAGRQAKCSEKSYDARFNKDIARKAFVSRRPASTESDKRNDDNASSLQRQGSLYRKCVSLEQTSPSTDAQEQIWRMDEDTDGSMTSIQSIDDVYLPRHKFEQSFDSRLSGGSTHSELLPSTLERKKKKGFLGKLKKLAKSSRNLNNDSSFPTSSASQGNPSGSNSSISSNIIPDQESSKRDLKHRITDFFKSDSRCNSLERASVTPSGSDFGDIPGTSLRKIVDSNTLPRTSTANKNEKSGTPNKNMQPKKSKS